MDSGSVKDLDSTGTYFLPSRRYKERKGNGGKMEERSGRKMKKVKMRKAVCFLK
jgi:hypothetical protein